MSETSPIVSSQPDPFIPETDKNEDWWIRNVRWICNSYNRPTGVWDNDDYIENLNPVEKGMQYSLYLMGKQRNIDYNHVTTDPSGNTLQAVWTKTKKVKNLVDRLAEQWIAQLKAKEINAKSLSERAISQRMRLWEDIMIQYDRHGANLIKEFQEAGVEYTPPFAGKHNSQEDAERFLNYDFKDDLEEAATLLGRHVEWENDANTSYVQAFINDFCPANVMGMYWYAEMGRVKQKRIPFYNLIRDASSNDPFMRDGRFVGIIERLTPQQVFNRYPNIGPEQKKEIEELAKAENNDFYNNFLNTYNTDNLTWWATTRGALTVTVVTGWWLGPHDIRYSVVEDGYKNKKIKETEEGKMGDYVFEDIHKATLVGNKYLVDWGYEKNVVRSTYSGKPMTPELPVKVMNGNTILGDGISIIGSIAQLIDKIDMIEFKITELMGKHIGKTYAFNGAKFPDGVDMKRISTDLKTMGVTVLEPSGEPNDPSATQQLAQEMDFTLDRAIIDYSTLVMRYEAMAEAQVNIPKVAQGLDTTIGLGVQKGAVVQSSKGNVNLLENLLKYNEINLQFAVNFAKIVYGEDGESPELASLIVGDRGLKVLKIIRQRKFEDVLISMSARDVITEAQHSNILSIAQALAQNDRLDMLDYLDIMQAQTFVEARNSLEMRLKKRDEMEVQSQNFQAQQMQDIENRITQRLLAAEQMKQQGQDKRKEMEIHGNVATQIQKGENKLEEIQATNKKQPA